MHFRNFSKLIVLHFTLCTLTTHAGEKFEYYNGVRSLAMGGARIAVVNDETAMLVNPAALGKLRDYFVTVADPEISFGTSSQAIIGADITAFIDPQTMLDKLTSEKGVQFHQRVSLFPSFVVQNFGIGVYGNYATNANVNLAGTEYSLDYVNDYAVVLGFNFRLFDGKVKLGFNARATNRVEISRNSTTTTIPANSTGLTIEGLAKEGFGIGSDVGLILTGPWMLLPTIAVVYRDAGDTHYNINDGLFYSTSERPLRTPSSLDVALAIFPIISNKTRVSFSLEYRDALSEDQEDIDDPMRRTHAGLEFNFSDAFFIRFGYHQRYFSTGLEISMLNYQLQFASYSEEIGTAALPVEDKRFVGKFAFRF
ncbi:MAG: hypothetical protein KDD61_10875 [Bdellovibrionales bacterium]|nr:hypothetical protein [Bdellovibrionales bacterium]